MQNGVHFISGLPRSGSTLLSAILRQNPRFHATITSPVAGLFHSLLAEMSVKNDFAYAFDDRRKRSILSGLFKSYYDDVQNDKIIFDTSRLWCGKMPTLADLFPSAKIIACVRDVPWIFDSIERLIRTNKYDLSVIFRCDPGGTVYTRCDALAAPTGMVGSGWQALKQAYYSEEADRLLLVTYEALTSAPGETMAQIYDFLNEPAFKHDFTNVAAEEPECDDRLGTPGLHTVRSHVERAARATILPPDLFRRFQSDTFWADPQGNIRGVRMVRANGASSE